MNLFTQTISVLYIKLIQTTKRAKFRLNIRYNDIKIKLIKEKIAFINFEMKKFRNSNLKEIKN